MNKSTNFKILSKLLIIVIFFYTVNVSATEVEKFVFPAGSIPIVFQDNITEEDVDILVNSYELTWESHFPKEFSYYLEILKGSPNIYIQDLKKSDIVLWAEIRENPEIEPEVEYILVRFKVKETEKEAKELISSFKNLQIKLESIPNKYGNIKVPTGEEQKWLEIFKNEDIVKSIPQEFINQISSNKEDLRNKPYKKSNPMYFIIILIIIIIITIFILIKRLHKSK